MTLMNGLIHDRKAYLWTDTLLSTQDGKTPLAHVTKFAIPPSRKWAAILSGSWPADDFFIVHKAILNAKPKTLPQLLKASVKALHKLDHYGLSARMLLAVPCKDYGARLFLVSGDALPFTGAFEPYETVQYMSAGNGAAGAPCDPETPEQMRQFIEWQARIANTAPIAGDLIEIEVSAKGVTLNQLDGYFSESYSDS